MANDPGAISRFANYKVYQYEQYNKKGSPRNVIDRPADHCHVANYERIHS